MPASWTSRRNGARRLHRVLPGRTAACVLAALLAIGTAVPSTAQEMEPRSYSNAPVGMNFLAFGLGYLAGDVATDPAVAFENAQLDAWMPAAGYARVIDVWGKSGRFEMATPYGCTEGAVDYRGSHHERDVCGFGDPSVKLSVNLLGAPAMNLRELAGWRQDTIVGIGLRIGMPLGQYDPDKLLNIGSNRWSIKPEIGISKAVGRFTFELIGGVAFYTRNDDYFGGREREQDPIHSVQAHAIYAFRSGAWIALDLTGYRGGRTTLDGVRGDDMQRNSRIGLTYALPLDRRNSLKISLATGTTTRIGGDFDSVGILWQHRWGGGS